MIKLNNPFKKTHKQKIAKYLGLNSFEQKLLKDWLKAMNITPHSLEQLKAYSKYPVFQWMLQDMRLLRKKQKTIYSRIRKFLKYKLPMYLAAGVVGYGLGLLVAYVGIIGMSIAKFF